MWKCESLGHVWLFATPWTVARQAPPSTGKNPGVGCHALLQGIFLTQGSNPALLLCKQILYHLTQRGSPPNNVYISLKLNLPPPPVRLKLVKCTSLLRFSTGTTLTTPKSLEWRNSAQNSALLPTPGLLPNGPWFQCYSLLSSQNCDFFTDIGVNSVRKIICRGKGF